MLTLTVGDEAIWPHAEESGFYFPFCEHTWDHKLDRMKMSQQMCDEAGHPVAYATALCKLKKNTEGRMTGAIAQNTETKAYIAVQVQIPLL